MSGSSSGISKEAETSNISLPRRLVSQSAISNISPVINHSMHTAVQKTGSNFKQRKIVPPTGTEHHFPGSNSRHRSQQSLSLQGKTIENNISVPGVYKKKVSFSTQIIARDNVLVHPPRTVLQTQNASIARTARSTMAANGGILRRQSQGDTSHGSSSNMVDPKTECIAGAFVPYRASTTGNHY